MLNFIAARVINWSIATNGPLRAPRTVVPETRAVLESARLPILIPETRLHAGGIVALVAAVGVYWLAWGGGGIQVMGLAPYNFTTGFNVGLGFDSIAVAVLGGIHPFGVVLASLLFGAMDAGARLVQRRTKVPIDIVTIAQRLIPAFVAADQI